MPRVKWVKSAQLLAEVTGGCEFHRRESSGWLDIEGLPELQENSEQWIESHVYVFLNL